jgi:hypothetical protein
LAVGRAVQHAKLRRRFFAGFGLVWITTIVSWLVFFTPSPIAAKLAWAEYGIIGLIAMVGIWQGKDADTEWERRMRRTQIIGFCTAVGLFLIAALPHWI